MQKTNAMRILDGKKIKYNIHDYSDTDAVSGVEVAAVLGENPENVYKTLVTTGKSGTHFVFVIPVAEELDLKKAAAAAGEKAVEMLPLKELLPLTGYIHGGCSPVGMKKAFATFVNITAERQPIIFVSGGKVGLQIELSPSELTKAVPFSFCDLIRE